MRTNFQTKMGRYYSQHRCDWSAHFLDCFYAEKGKIKVFPLDSRNRESFFVSIGMALIHSFAATIRWDVYPIYPISFSEQPFSLLYKTKRNFPVSILDTGKLE